MVYLLAKEFGILEIVSVVPNPDHVSVFHRIGAHVMENPQRLIAEHLYQAVSRPQLIDFMQLSGSAEIFDIAVAEEAAITGKTLEEAASECILTEDLLIVAINPPGNEPPITPKGGTRIEAGDILTVNDGAYRDLADQISIYLKYRDRSDGSRLVKVAFSKKPSEDVLNMLKRKGVDAVIVYEDGIVRRIA